ncbi:similar to Saccharomyces cerevisiae YEL058W PCM1 Essential N-acetylglucosamine-phosphate mutase [Maudiozyma saulgeensis]|uniref:Phosphoacetylglucosamine mutase n=1 Tax=Maudiozyma saulgeensis TaxID=1789683 RepID=A0A1X7RBH5_9SACH|nr:similar to Saccharomyces cerevisiae YEL058W PCM1 Essential N-acetylglucosamine-phosphate mutase [Kazachstania saulgeensis]
MQLELLESLFDKTCKTKNYTYTYGTAGFRDKAAVLDTVMFTTGIIASLRSMSHQGKAVGVMITASHNPPMDNGVKIIEPDGSMLSQSWESLATNLANITANENFLKSIEFIKNLIISLNIDSNIIPSIVVGMDSRESSPRLMNCLLSTLSPIFNAKIINHNMLTTPQLHFLTAYQNENCNIIPAEKITVNQYDTNFQTAFNDLLKLYEIKNFNNCFNNLIVDCANGIGAPQFENFIKGLPQSNLIKFINNNYKHPDTLNNSCGADFVKTQQKLPAGVNDDPSLLTDSNLYCSFDGDADRIIFYYIDQTNKFHLLDGDKIATLFAKFLKKLLLLANLNDIKLGIVQTAYANGSSTTYVSNTLNVPVSCTKTGVKHLHHEAQTAYDIGIYFEANGHGTILFSNNFYSKVQSCLEITKDESITKACKTLLAFSKVINQTVGDAIADLLGVVATLLISEMKPYQWDQQYTDLPNLLSKVIVPDRNVFKTTDQERKLTSPPGLQNKMDTLINKIEMGRAFVRASGTEDAVRIYCEGKNAEDVKKLSKDIEALIMAEVN